MLKIEESHALSRSKLNKNYFVKKGSLIIAGFKYKEDAKMFLTLKQNVQSILVKTGQNNNNMNKENDITWEFVEWAEKSTYEAFIKGVDNDGWTYEAIGIMGDGEIQEVKDIELDIESKKRACLDIIKDGALAYSKKLNESLD